MRKNGYIIKELVTKIYLMIIVAFIVNIFFQMIKPVMVYQKSIYILNKYVYLLERFGSLTEEENLKLKEELDILLKNNYTLDIPLVLKNYNSLFEVKLNYVYHLKYPSINKEKVIIKNRTIPININRYGYVKSLI